MEKWFSREIVKWYLVNKRNLPWRDEKDPYLIWLSEIILQQTQVAQGMQYYLKFTSAFPTVNHLARASEDTVLKLWQGLGYYSRARNLLQTAKVIASEYKGEFPHTYNEIRQLKGIGDYTAAAIASFAFDLPHAVVDGNVYRLLSRVYGIASPIDTTSGKKEFARLAADLLGNDPGLHNQAIMEFGSQQCKPYNPACDNCPLSHRCQAFRHGMVNDLPVKSKKVTVRNRFFNYLVIADQKGNVRVRRREGKDIWQGLYEFPLVETDRKISVPELLKTRDAKVYTKNSVVVRHVSEEYTHILTHQRLNARFCVAISEKELKGTEREHITRLNSLAFPRLIEKFLNDCDLKEIL
jgi:A/G-specific adenine glycosylase